MPVTFYGRTTEFEALNDELEQVRSGGRTRLVAIRGRRQVGKSTLVERFAETAGVPYASLPGMKGTTEATQVSYSLEALRSSLRPLPDRAILEAATPPSTWVRCPLLIPFAVGETPTIVVLDEFPWMMEASSERLDGLLKAMLDGEFRRRQVLLILVGSDEAMMEQLFKHDQPLFNKADRLLVVSPFNPAETAAALGGTRTALQVFDAQLVTGGFPGLVEQAKREGSIKNFVVASLSKADSPLVDAAQIRLAGELLESENARLVLSAIGADEMGEIKYSRIADRLGGDRKAAEGKVDRALEVLVEAKRIVATEFPGGNRQSRLKRYRIADSYLRFWFRFIEPNLRSIQVGRFDIAVKSYETGWEAWRGKAIEPVVREGFLLLAPSLGTPYESIESVDGWWDRTERHEFDLVGSTRRGGVDAVGSIKWRTREKFHARELSELANARSVVDRASAARLVVVSTAGVEVGVEPDLSLGAEELLAVWPA